MRSPVRIPAALSLLLATALPGCRRDANEAMTNDVSVPLSEDRLDSDALEAGRFDPEWRVWADRDRRSRHAGPAGTGADTGGATGPTLDPVESERFEEIRPAAVNFRPRLPIPRSGAGPSMLHVQILLDRARFSPGILDGRWGKNTEKAVYWFQHAQALPPTGIVDQATYDRLAEAAGPGAVVVPYRPGPDDLAGPFVEIPDDVYEQAELDCLCYESRGELLSERFHSTREVLGQLNPGIDLDRVDGATTLQVPNVADGAAPAHARRVARIVVARKGFYTHALDADGRVVYHFPSTLGTKYNPSPTGKFHVVAITRDPHFHYQPMLFHEVPDEEPEAMLNPGPNSPVGVVWMALSEPHFGIHGTAEPQTIGYTTSHGCVRLTNWDAHFLTDHTPVGTPVEFR